MKDSTIKAPASRWKRRTAVLFYRLVDSWTKIGLFFLLTGLVALGILVFKPNRRDRVNAKRSRGTGFRPADRDDELNRAQHGFSDGPSKDARVDQNTEGKGKSEHDDDCGLDLEDTCIVQ